MRTRIENETLSQHLTKRSSVGLQYDLLMQELSPNYILRVSKNGQIISKVDIPFGDLLMKDYTKIWNEFERAESLYNTKLFKALK